MTADDIADLYELANDDANMEPGDVMKLLDHVKALTAERDRLQRASDTPQSAVSRERVREAIANIVDDTMASEPTLLIAMLTDEVMQAIQGD